MCVLLACVAQPKEMHAVGAQFNGRQNYLPVAAIRIWRNVLAVYAPNITTLWKVAFKMDSVDDCC